MSSSKFTSPFMAKSPLHQQEFVRDTIRLNPKKLIEGKNINDGLLDDVYADKIAKKAKWWGKGKLKKGIGYYDVADMSQVMYDEEGPYVVNLKQNESFKPGNVHEYEESPLKQKVITKEPKDDIGTALSVSPGYEPLEMITGREKAKKIKGKLGRKQRKLAKTDRQMQDIGNRIMFEKTPDTISQKADRKMKKYFKTKNQINEIKNNK